MSHFSVLVVTKTPEELEAVLQPFHEFECTGVDDQYVKDIDDTEELRKEYEASDKSEPFVGWAHGWTGRPIVVGTVNKEETKYGYILVEGEKVTCIDRTNPDRKWDWWQLGGRWSGKLCVKPLADAVQGQPGLFGTRTSEHGYDQCKAGDLDFDAMERAARKRCIDSVENALGALAGKGILRPDVLRLWKDYVTAKPLVVRAWEDAGRPGRLWDWLAESPRVFEQPFCAMHAARNVIEALGDFIGAGVPDTEPDPIAWANNRPAFTAFAVLKDGQWIEKGEMGWFGCVSNEQDTRAWETKVSDLIKSLPADATISLVDCHI